jgi:hypothetical protein
MGACWLSMVSTRWASVDSEAVEQALGGRWAAGGVEEGWPISATLADTAGRSSSAASRDRAA